MRISMLFFLKIELQILYIMYLVFFLWRLLALQGMGLYLKVVKIECYLFNVNIKYSYSVGYDFILIFENILFYLVGILFLVFYVYWGGMNEFKI